MSTKLFLVLCVVVAIVGIAIGVFAYGQSPTSPAVVSQQSAAIPTTTAPTAAVGAVVDEKSLPSPVIAPVAATIKTVSESMIVVNGKDGEMTLPKDASIVTVLRRVNGRTTVAALSDVVVGMSVDVNIIKPGEKVNLILLQ